MKITQILITQIAITQQWHILATLIWLSLDTGMHGRLRGPISQLPLPSAKGSPWSAPRQWGRRNDWGRGKKKHGQRPSTPILTMVITPPFQSSLAHLQWKMTLSLPILQNHKFHRKALLVPVKQPLPSTTTHPGLLMGNRVREKEDEKNNPAGPGKGPEPGTHKEGWERESGVKFNT